MHPSFLVVVDTSEPELAGLGKSGRKYPLGASPPNGTEKTGVRLKTIPKHHTNAQLTANYIIDVDVDGTMAWCFDVPSLQPYCALEGVHVPSLSQRLVLLWVQLVALGFVRRRRGDRGVLAAWIAVLAASFAPFGAWWSQVVRVAAFARAFPSRPWPVLLVASVPLWLVATHPQLDTALRLRTLLAFGFGTSVALALVHRDVARLTVLLLLVVAQLTTIAFNEPIPMVTFGVVAWCWVLVSRASTPVPPSSPRYPPPTAPEWEGTYINPTS